MADTPPDKLSFGIGQGHIRNMVRLADGSYAERVATASGAGIVTDNTGQFTFDVASMASIMTYDSDGNQLSIIYGPDLNGRRIMQTSQWESGLLKSDSDWQLVDTQGRPVNGNGVLK